MTIKFFVVNTFQNKVESTHRTFKAADKADDKFRRAVKRANSSGCYIPTMIVEASSKEEALRLAPLLKAREVFQKAASDLEDLAYSDPDEWNEVLAADYPFVRCFSEVANDIRSWGV